MSKTIRSKFAWFNDRQNYPGGDFHKKHEARGTSARKQRYKCIVRGKILRKEPILD